MSGLAAASLLCNLVLLVYWIAVAALMTWQQVTYGNFPDRSAVAIFFHALRWPVWMPRNEVLHERDLAAWERFQEARRERRASEPYQSMLQERRDAIRRALGHEEEGG